MSFLVWLLLDAHAGSLDGLVAVDALSATARVPQAVVDAGGPEQVGASDLGLTMRGELIESDDRLIIGVDYRGRVPFQGQFPNRDQHLVYRADATWKFRKAEATAGRFFAPSAVWLSMDGLRVTLSGKPGTLVLFGGRRAISLSRRNVPVNTFLPVLGGHAARTQGIVTVDVMANLASDQLVLGNPEDEVTQDVFGGSAQARVAVRPREQLTVGTSASVANRATFAIGPEAGDLVATVQAMSLYNARAWSQWRMSEVVRLDATVLHQQITLSADNEDEVDLIDPSFTDLRVRVPIGTGDIGFIRPDQRVRFRRERTEWRAGVAGELHPDVLRGVYAFANGYLEMLFADQTTLDRSRWQVGAGVERGPAMVEAGIGVVDRAAGPVGGLASDLGRVTPTESEDLSPFVLEAQDIGFLRGFVTGRRWFAGADVEANLRDREIRAFLQIGYTGRTSW